MTKKYYIFYPKHDVFSKRCDIYDTVRAVLWDVIVTSEDGWLDFCWWCGAVERMGRTGGGGSLAAAARGRVERWATRTARPWGKRRVRTAGRRSGLNEGRLFLPTSGSGQRGRKTVLAAT